MLLNLLMSNVCRKNCNKNPFCLSGLGFEQWLSGEMDYSPSDDSEESARDLTEPAGLTNLGATCYVNAFLQLWYHNIDFRNAVYSWNDFEGMIYNTFT